MEIKSKRGELRNFIQKNRLEGRERERERNALKTGRVNLQMF